MKYAKRFFLSLIKTKIKVKRWYKGLQRTKNSFFVGTGMVGLELKRVGFNTIHASDMSVEIIKRAEEKVNILKNKLFIKNKHFQAKITPCWSLDFIN